MAWHQRWYGDNPSLHHKFVTNGLVFGALASLYGIFVNFIASEYWWHFGTYLSVFLAALLSGATYWGMYAGRIKSQAGTTIGRRVLGIVAIPFFYLECCGCSLSESSLTLSPALLDLPFKSPLQCAQSIGAVAAPVTTSWRGQSWIGHSRGTCARDSPHFRPFHPKSALFCRARRPFLACTSSDISSLRRRRKRSLRAWLEPLADSYEACCSRRLHQAVASNYSFKGNAVIAGITQSSTRASP